MMRASIPLALLIATLLTACASDKDVIASKHISQQGSLKVHPGLLGEPVPPELQPYARPAGATVGAQAAPIAAPAGESAPAETPPAKQGE
jgi:peptidoglycan-associated lipoprotein